MLLSVWYYFSGRQYMSSILFTCLSSFTQTSYIEDKKWKECKKSKLIEQSTFRENVSLSIRKKKRKWDNNKKYSLILYICSSYIFPFLFDLYLNWSDFIITWWQQCKWFDEGNQETHVWMYNWLRSNIYFFFVFRIMKQHGDVFCKKLKISLN